VGGVGCLGVGGCGVCFFVGGFVFFFFCFTAGRRENRGERELEKRQWGEIFDRVSEEGGGQKRVVGSCQKAKAGAADFVGGGFESGDRKSKKKGGAKKRREEENHFVGRRRTPAETVRGVGVTRKGDRHRRIRRKSRTVCQHFLRKIPGGGKDHIPVPSAKRKSDATAGVRRWIPTSAPTVN